MITWHTRHFSSLTNCSGDDEHGDQTRSGQAPQPNFHFLLLGQHIKLSGCGKNYGYENRTVSGADLVCVLTGKTQTE
jgi:hypothetical protein